MDQQSFLGGTYRYYHMPSYNEPEFAYVPFRSFSLPLRPSELGLADLHPPQQQTYHHHQPIYQPHHLQFPPVYAQVPPKMAYIQSEDELAEFQKLSNVYSPETTGPLLGVRQPSSAITAEYASADPIYQAKTAALPRKYSSYRTCRGDGRCGWRAIAFGYYESLLKSGDRNKFLQEEVRLKSLRNVCNAAGYDYNTLELFEEVALDLLKDTAATLSSHNAEATLVDAFNNEETQNFVITYFRMLTCSWIQTRPENYAPFMEPLSIGDYCAQYILAHAAELNDIGLNALTEVLLKPAGIALEVIYLDRSEGAEVNVHHYGPMTSSVATMRLLYRPGHYDILYKAEDVITTDQPPISSSVAAYQASDPTITFAGHDHGASSDILTEIPFSSLINHDPSWSFGTDSFGPSLMPMLPQHSAIGPSTSTSITAAYPPSSAFEDVFDSPVSAYGPPPTPADAFTNRAPQPTEDVFRPSRHMYEMHFNQSQLSQREQELRTSQFRNSRFNPCHFQNSDFTPEAWDPSTAYIVPPTTNRNRRSRSD